jgi:hypothetical protein
MILKHFFGTMLYGDVFQSDDRFNLKGPGNEKLFLCFFNLSASHGILFKMKYIYMLLNLHIRILKHRNRQIQHYMTGRVPNIGFYCKWSESHFWFSTEWVASTARYKSYSEVRICNSNRSLIFWLKVPKREIFHRSDFPDFYIIKSLCGGDFGVKIKNLFKSN